MDWIESPPVDRSMPLQLLVVVRSIAFFSDFDSTVVSRLGF
jgi:hypothetical protein